MNTSQAKEDAPCGCSDARRERDAQVAYQAFQAAKAGALPRGVTAALVNAVVRLMVGLGEVTEGKRDVSVYEREKWLATARDVLLDAAVAGEKHQAMDMADFAQYMAQRIADDDLDIEDIPVRMYRYGRMDPCQFDAEMIERVQSAREEAAR